MAPVTWLRDKRYQVRRAASPSAYLVFSYPGIGLQCEETGGKAGGDSTVKDSTPSMEGKHECYTSV